MEINISLDKDPSFRTDLTDQEITPIVTDVKKSIAEVSAHCVAFGQKPIDNLNVLLGNYFFSGGFEAPNTVKVSVLVPDEVSPTIAHELCHFKRYAALGNQARTMKENPKRIGSFLIVPGVFAVEEGFARIFEIENGHQESLNNLEGLNWPRDYDFTATKKKALDFRDCSMEVFCKKSMLHDSGAGIAIVAGYLGWAGKKVVETFDVSYEEVLDKWRKGNFDLVTTREQLLPIISP